MRTNPPEAAVVATIYRLWERSHCARTWNTLGDVLAILARRWGGWQEVHQFCADYLSVIPIHHIAAAYADQQGRELRKLIHLN